jgi:uridine kinase
MTRRGSMATLIELAGKAQENQEHSIILAKVDGRLSELNGREITDQRVEFITTASGIGNDTYRRSVLFMMLYAIHKLRPEMKSNNVVVEYSLSKGLYCEITDDFKVDYGFVEKVK